VTSVASTASLGRPIHFVAWLVGERLVRSVVTAVVLAAVARHLAPAGFGVLNFALAVVGVAMPLAQLGLEGVLVRELVRRPADAGALLGSAAVLRLAVGAACLVAIEAFALVPRFAAARGALAVAGLLLLVQAAEVTDLWFRRRVESRPAAIARLSALLGGAALKLALVAAGAGVVAFVVVQVLEAVFFVGGLAWAYARGDEKGPAWRWDPATARALWREGRGFALGALVGSLALRVDQFAVSGWLGAADTGRYFAALRLIELPTFVATTAAASLLPALAADVGRTTLARNFAVLSALGWLTALGATLAGPWLVPRFFGPDYAAATPILILQAWACLPLFTGLVRAQYLAVHSAPGTQLATAMLTLAGQGVLNFVLVPWLGLTGAACAFLLTQLASAWLFPLLLPALRPCLKPQWLALREAWKPNFWRELAGVPPAAEIGCP